MKKRIIVTVNCANDLAGDVPGAFTIVISQALAGRIKALAKVLVDHSADEIETSNYAGTWSEASIYDWGCDQSAFDEETLVNAIEDLEENEADIDIPRLRVTVHDFCFSAVPKHAGDDLMLTTLRIPLSALDTDEPYIRIE